MTLPDPAQDAHKLCHDRRVAALAALNAENQVRALVNTESLIFGLDRLDLELLPYRTAAQRYLNALDHLHTLNARARRLGVQP